MRHASKLTPKAYLSAMKQRMSSHMAWGSGRFTGFFLGNVFSVTHHFNYRWTEQRSNVKCTALGYVKKTPEGTQVRFICLRSYLAPTQFLFVYMWAFLLTGLLMLARGLNVWGPAALICLAAMAVVAPLSAWFESRTEKGHEGMRCLMALVLNPEDPQY